MLAPSRTVVAYIKAQEGGQQQQQQQYSRSNSTGSEQWGTKPEHYSAAGGRFEAYIKAREGGNGNGNGHHSGNGNGNGNGSSSSSEGGRFAAYIAKTRGQNSR